MTQEHAVETPDSIRLFWFGASGDDRVSITEQSRLWWSKKEAVDKEIQSRFAPTIDKAARGELDAWAGEPEGLLALILLTDQFPRNAFRGTPRAFSFDDLARTWCRQALATGFDRALRPIERVFLYLPLEHSESPEDQERSVSLYRELAAEVRDDALRGEFEGFLSFAIRHRDIVLQFGRFPHRNQTLGRPSTPREIEFLKQKGSSF